MAAGACLGYGFDRDIVVTEKLHIDAGKRFCEGTGDPLDFPALRAPDDHLAFFLGSRVHLSDFYIIKRLRAGSGDGQQRGHDHEDTRHGRACTGNPRGTDGLTLTH